MLFGARPLYYLDFASARMSLSAMSCFIYLFRVATLRGALGRAHDMHHGFFVSPPTLPA